MLPNSRRSSSRFFEIRGKSAGTKPDIDTSDFYSFEHLLADDDRALLHAVRDWTTADVAPIVNSHWEAATFPFDVIPGFAKLGLGGLPYKGYGCRGSSFLLDGMVAMELARTDSSIATFNGVHGGLAVRSVYLCGNDEQRERFLPDMARYDKIGAFGLTEPDAGSWASGGLGTTAERRGDTWILNGQKKWIGNATFSDLTIIWAKDVADGQVKGFVVENSSPGFTAEKQSHKIALRIVQNALITLDNVEVPEENRLQNANSFKDTAEVLRVTRAGVAWMAIGCARGAYENALVRLRARTVRPADRQLPACPGSAGPDARATSPRRSHCALDSLPCRTRA